jgi:RNA polymerase sigma-70 factor (ECF subfamily)
VRQIQIGRLYRTRFDSSDVVQEAMVRAIKSFEQVRGQEESELIRWLQVIVGNVVVDLVREHGASKRDPRLERTICDASEDGDTPLAAYLSGSGTGPGSLAAQREQLLQLATAVEALPEAERDAVIAHYILELPLSETASRLQRSEKGVAGLLFRGKKRLRELLAETER